MSLILAFSIGYVPSDLTAAGLTNTVLSIGEYKSTDYNTETRKYDLEVIREYFVLEFAVGRIVKQWVRQNVQIMSDVWADTYHCVIALPDGTFLEYGYACSENHYVMGRFTRCTVDAPELLPAYEAWRAEKTRLEAEAEELRLAPFRAAQKAQAEKDAARKAKSAAKLSSAREQAEQLLAQAPGKGSRVKVGTQVGEVFWAGVTQHRGKVSARLGVRTGQSRADVVWCDAAEVARA